MPKLNLPPALDDHLIEGRARLELDFDQPYLLGPLFGDYDHLLPGLAAVARAVHAALE